MRGSRGPGTQRCEQRFDQMRQRRLADPAQRERRDRDAKLRRREIGVEPVDRAMQRGGVHASERDQFGDTAAPHGNQRKFGGNEESVGEHEQQHRADAPKIRSESIHVD